MKLSKNSAWPKQIYLVRERVDGEIAYYVIEDEQDLIRYGDGIEIAIAKIIEVGNAYTSVEIKTDVV